MGLDAWIFTGRRPDENRIPPVPHTKDLEKLGYSYFNEDRDIKDLLPICIHRVCMRPSVNLEKIKQDHNIPADAGVGGFSRSNSKATLSFYKEKERYEATVLLDEYTETVTVPLYITELKEITYWRNEHDLQMLMGEIYHEYSGQDIENGGYYHLTREMIAALNKKSPLFREECFSETDDSLYYSEWY